MLFKTLNASVYGIDAYLVEVEVDVGSARMTDFNVVGLPDNAVKEAASASSPPYVTAVSSFPMARASP
jgi:magnesium chelatase family protein